MTILNAIPIPETKILLVDDDPMVLDLLGMTLTSLGYSFETAANGREAIEVLAGGGITILITDMVMPEIDGMELLGHVKDKYPKVGVIVVTGYTGTFTYTDVIRAGANDFIAKPFGADEFEAKIKRLLREQQVISGLEYLSSCDPLTGLFNRRNFDDRLREEVHRASRQRYRVFLAMIDIDNFKLFNDYHGHQAGDEVLVAVGDILGKCTRRDVDLLFRYGGDEFTVIIPHTSWDQAEQICERILQTFRETTSAGTGLSIGLAEFVKGSGTWEDDTGSLVRRADKALYLAKERGRNQLASDPDHPVSLSDPEFDI